MLKKSLPYFIALLLLVANYLLINKSYRLVAFFFAITWFIYITISLLRNNARIVEKEAALKISNELLEDAQRIGHMGNWSYNKHLNKIIWSNEMYNIWGIKVGLPIPEYAWFYERIHPADREKEDMADYTKNDRGYNFEFRIILDDHTRKWVHTIGKISIDKNGGVIGTHGTLQDITIRKVEEVKLKESLSGLAIAQRLSKMGSWDFDIENDKLTWSDNLYHVFGTDKKTFTESHGSFIDLVVPEDQELVRQTSELSQKTGESFNVEYCILTAHGKKRFIHEYGYGEKNKEGKVIRLYGTAQDITERKNAEEENSVKAKLLNTIGQAVIVTDISGKITFWNHAAEAMYGWKFYEVISLNISDVVVIPGQYLKQAKIIMEQLSQGKTWSGEFAVQKRDGTMIPIYVTNSPVYNENNKITGVIGVSTDMSQRKKDEEDLIIANYNLRILSDYLQNIREDERKRIAREIHDELGQQLTAIKMDVSSLYKKQIINNPEQEQKLSGLFVLIDNTIKTVRKIASDLRPAILDDLGLEEAIKWQIAEFTKRTGIPMKFISTIEDEKFSEAISTCVFRVFQEALTNITRHANASHVVSKLCHESGELLFTIRDNGVGFDIEKSGKIRSMGLLGMKERINMLNGKYEISSQVGKGTMIKINLPLA